MRIDSAWSNNHNSECLTISLGFSIHRFSCHFGRYSLLEIGQDQDRLIRTCCFHQHCSYFIDSLQFKTYIISNGEQSGFIEVTKDNLIERSGSSVRDKTRKMVYEFGQTLQQSVYPKRKPSHKSPWWIRCIFPLIVISRLIHVLWPFIVLTQVSWSTMLYLDKVLWTATLVLSISTCVLCVCAVAGCGGFGFYRFLWFMFPDLMQLPEIRVSWRYFDRVPDVYRLTLSIPARNELLERRFGQNVASIILMYLESMGIGMPVRIGGG